MKFQAAINIMPNKELLDPKGKAVEKNLVNLQLEALQNVRIGKRITLNLEADSQSEAEALVDKACKNLLANMIMEKYDYSVEQLSVNSKQ